jgi:ankyrin repeat protein
MAHWSGSKGTIGGRSIWAFALCMLACSEKPSSFTEACKRGDLGFVNRALENNSSLVSMHSSENGASALYLAAANGHEAIVSVLLRHEAKVDEKSQFGAALHAAATGEYPKVVEMLLTAKASVDARDDWGQTPLHLASVSNRDGAVVGLLLGAGASPNARDRRGLTPLHRATSSKVIAALLKGGADPKATDSEGRTALHWAAAPRQRYDLNAVSILIAAGTPLDARDAHDDTAASLAKKSGKPDLATRLMPRSVP